MNDPLLKLYIFYCSNSIDTVDMSRCCSQFDGDTFKTISLPCSGKVDALYLIKAFETGADGVVIVTCKEGECCYLEGNLRARKRAEAVDSLLEEIGYGRGRMAVIRMTEGGAEQLILDIREFRSGIKTFPRHVPQMETLDH